MRINPVLHIISILLIFLGAALILPLIFSVYYNDGSSVSLLLSILISVLSGLVLFKFTSAEGELKVKEGFGIVTFGWLFLVLYGTLPYILSGSITNFTDAFFESMSGITTTGATILTDIESVPKGILMWRCLSQWMGGMGIIVFSLAILPILGIGGMSLFKAEVPGPTPDRLKPRIQETAKVLWGVYLIFSGSEVILLMAGGMSLYDALCHTFATLATGGFSPKNASIAYYNSTYIDIVITFFMFCAGVNFSLHYQGMKGNVKAYFRNKEFRFYVGLIIICLIIITADIMSRYEGLGTSLRYSVFQVISIHTTTGFGTADYELWHPLSQFVLFVLMFVGGCAGSTGGGAKVIRFMVVIKQMIVELKKTLHPLGVIHTEIDKKEIPSGIVANVLTFLLIFIGSFVIASGVMMFLGLDMVSAMGAVIASIGNIGPGLGLVGPTDNYAFIHPAGKWLLSFCMLLGRLEFFTVLVVFYKDFWKK